jgi:deoxyribonuclease-4
MTSTRSKQPIGAHVSISGSIDRAIGRGVEIGCTAIQIFTKNANQWKAKPISQESAKAFKTAWQESSIGPIIAHDTYLINLAAPDDEKWAKSKAAFIDELERCAQLGVPDLVMHPGSHLTTGEDVGIDRVALAFREIFQEAPESVRVLIEITAGQGSNLGYKFEHIAKIMEKVPSGHFGVCFDTCHALAAGYDLTTADGYAAVMAEFDRIIGCDQIKAFHVNDSKKGLGSHVDRHEQLGEGAVGIEGFRALMQDKRFAAIPKILETPKGDDNSLDLRNLDLLHKLAEEK